MAYTNLIVILKDEINIYNELLAIGMEKSNTIKENDLVTLKQMNTVELALTNKIDKLELQRKEEFSALAKEFNCEITLGFLIEKSNSNELKNIKNKILKVTREIQEVTKSNEELLELAIMHNNSNLTIIKELDQDIGTYTKSDLGR
ncbi:MAG: flagellar protein FlgN [Lachnospirales bacterium]